MASVKSRLKYCKIGECWYVGKQQERFGHNIIRVTKGAAVVNRQRTKRWKD
jgi:hypothetical protein